MATAYVLINCELGSEESIISQLKNLEGVIEVHVHLEHTIFLQKLNLVLLKHYEKQLLGKFVRLRRLDQL